MLTQLICLLLLALKSQADSPAAIIDAIAGLFDPDNLLGSKVFTKEQQEIRDSYDFVVVGSGSAGSTLAARLSENPDWKILLLEVGRPENRISGVPLFAPILQLTDYNWNYVTEPQPDLCLAMKEQRCAFPRGRALGGSSVINYMIYTRGNRQDYDNWEAAGNPGWGYDDILPYFIKSENVALERFEHPYHRKGGYLGIGDTFHTEMGDAFLQAAQEMGHKVRDYNGKSQNGFSFIQGTLKKGRRQSVAKAFLEPASLRPNLHILTSSRAIKINIDPVTKRTLGVVYTHRGHTYQVSTKKEVILSAGAFGSPQLLMLSGIGPKDHLEELGIETIEDLPVGRNMQDHVAYIGLTFLVNKTVPPPSVVFNPANVLKWYNTGEGPLASLGGIEALGYINTKDIKDDYPNVELIFTGSGGLHTDYGIFNRKFVRISDAAYEQIFRPAEGTPAWTVFQMLLHPKSKGYLKLNSTHPKAAPLFYPGFLTDPLGEDRAALVASIKFSIELSQTNAFSKYNTTLSPTKVPQCAHLESDTYWNCTLNYLATTLHHQVGTCKMGPSNDPEAVVNHELKVYGVQGLRVADTSIIPQAPSAHTNAPAIMIGERVADMIKNEWK